MQRRHFMKLTGMLATLPAIKGIAATSEKPAPSGKQLYEWRIYTLEEDADGLDGFFRDTLIPAYNRKNIKAGAFVPYKKEEKERRNDWAKLTNLGWIAALAAIVVLLFLLWKCFG